jgi:Leucine-rich repeat (LRR) protein
MIGQLPCLRSLDLSNNGLRALPLAMAAAEDADVCESNFKELDTLTLDDNKLTSPGVFQALAGR